MGLRGSEIRKSGLFFKYPSQLSGGQQQRVAIARAIIMITHEPDIAAYAERIASFRDGKVLEDSRIQKQEVLKGRLGRVAVL
jgi:ABC-type lipoprotein export system ATPase subunit